MWHWLLLPLASHWSIILSNRVIQLDSSPLSGRKLCGPEVAQCSHFGSIDNNSLPNFDMFGTNTGLKKEEWWFRWTKCVVTIMTASRQAFFENGNRKVRKRFSMNHHWNFQLLQWLTTGTQPLAETPRCINVSVRTTPSDTIIISYTVEPDLIATEMLVFPLKSAWNKNDRDLTIAIP